MIKLYREYFGETNKNGRRHCDFCQAKASWGAYYLKEEVYCCTVCRDTKYKSYNDTFCEAKRIKLTNRLDYYRHSLMNQKKSLKQVDQYLEILAHEEVYNYQEIYDWFTIKEKQIWDKTSQNFGQYLKK